MVRWTEGGAVERESVRPVIVPHWPSYVGGDVKQTMQVHLVTNNRIAGAVPLIPLPVLMPRVGI